MLGFQVKYRFAVRVGGEIPHIAGVVAPGIVKAMLLFLGRKVGTGGFEFRAGANALLVKMNRVVAGAKPLKLHVHVHAGFFFGNFSLALHLAAGVFQGHFLRRQRFGGGDYG